MPKKILIIDDEEDLLKLISEHFRSSGWETLTVENGMVALLQVSLFNPDVILSDIMMPEKDGLQFLEALYLAGNDVPLVFLTAFRDVDKMKRAWGLGAFDFLDKPVDLNAVLRVAENAFNFGREYVVSARKRYLTLKKMA